jgi:hypothetical protein
MDNAHNLGPRIDSVEDAIHMRLLSILKVVKRFYLGSLWMTQRVLR